jgi:hypothetical protein
MQRYIPNVVRVKYRAILIFKRRSLATFKQNSALLGIGEHWSRQYYNIVLFFEGSAFSWYLPEGAEENLKTLR